VSLIAEGGRFSVLELSLLFLILSLINYGPSYLVFVLGIILGLVPSDVGGNPPIFYYPILLIGL